MLPFSRIESMHYERAPRFRRSELDLSAHVLSKEVEAIRHVRDDRLRRRELKPAFLQELLDEGFDLFFQ